MNDDNEIDVFFNDDNESSLVGLYQEAAKNLDSFISLINEAVVNSRISQEERYDIELMSDISGTMLIQLLNLIKSKQGDYEFLDDTSRMDENGNYED